MEQQNKVKIVKLPGITSALLTGFNLVADHIYLILFPVLIDLKIWLGPRLSVYNLVKDGISSILAQLSNTAPIGMISQVALLQQASDAVLKGFNLMGTFNFLPISTPSLLGLNVPLSSESADIKPLLPGIQTIEIQSVWMALLLFILFSLTGFILGILYFSMIAHAAKQDVPGTKRLTLRRLGKLTVNVILMLILFVFLVLLLLIPISCVLTLFLSVSPTLSQIVSFFILLSVAWMIVPVFFSFHGLFYEHGISNSVRVSLNLGKWFSSPTSFFIVAVVIIAQGLNLIWTIPDTNSWLLLIGILGHAYVTTALITASFILYQNYLKWIIDNEELITKGKI